MRRWKCTICRYIHEGDRPPDICPICKAGSEKFVEIDASGLPIASASPVAPRPKGPIGRLVEKHHAHPIAVHLPNGVIPVSVAFAFAAAALSFAGLAQAAFYNNLCVAAGMPAVLLTGYLSWLTKYNGVLTRRFLVKIVSSTVSALSAISLVVWQYANPAVLGDDSPGRAPFLLLNLVMLAGAAVAGFVGGKLVFRD